MRQIPLKLRLQSHMTFDDFFAGPNVELTTRLKAACLGRDAEGAIYLWGAAGSGKSHLLQAACEMATQNNITPLYLPLRELLAESTQMLDELEQLSLICIDDVDAVAGNLAWETALFHLFNRAFDRGTQLVFSANVAPAYLATTLPDLASRLAWGFVYHVLDLNDEERVLALQKTARQRGFDLPESVAIYLMRRFPRDTKSMYAMLNDLDQASLSAQRKLTVPFIKNWLDEKQNGAQQLLPF